MIHTTAPVAFETSVDGFLDTSFAVCQPAKGAHRAGLDAVLLAACLSDIGHAQVMDFGAGCGVAGFAVAQRNAKAKVTLVERDPDMAALARYSLLLPQTAHLSGRIEVVETDIGLRANPDLPPDCCDHIIANPPFNGPHLQASPDAKRAGAHAFDAVSGPSIFDIWLRSAARVTRVGGTATMIARPQDLAALLAAMEGRFGGICLRPVHPREQFSASRILLQGTRGSKAPLSMCPPLVLHGDDGGYLPEVEAVLRGRGSVVMTPCKSPRR